MNTDILNGKRLSRTFWKPKCESGRDALQLSLTYGSLISLPFVFVCDRPGFHDLNSGRNKVKFFLFAQTEVGNVWDSCVRSASSRADDYKITLYYGMCCTVWLQRFGRNYCLHLLSNTVISGERPHHFDTFLCKRCFLMLVAQVYDLILAVVLQGEVRMLDFYEE
jgi:hypothetical protein